MDRHPMLAAANLGPRRSLRASAAASLAFVTGCAAGNGTETTSVREIVADPRGHYGEDVVVEATVSREIDHRVWEMADGKVLAIRDEPLHPLPTSGERMRLKGTIHPLDKATIEGELEINIEDHFFTDDFLADDVALVVDSVERLDR